MLYKRLFGYIFLLILMTFIALAGYEAHRVSIAMNKVNDVFSPYTSQNTEILRWQDLNEWQQKALIKIEDPNFFQHKGIDFSTKGAGLTSIPQAIAKRLFFKPFKPGFAKIEQSLIARYVITPNISKEDQLTTFLNIAYLGNMDDKAIIGFQQAAQWYFKKKVSALSQDEFLRLVGALMAPNQLLPIVDNEKSDQRLSKLRRLIDGACQPKSLTDVTLEAC